MKIRNVDIDSENDTGFIWELKYSDGVLHGIIEGNDIDFPNNTITGWLKIGRYDVYILDGEYA